MSQTEDAEITQELEVLVAAKEAQQRVMKAWFAAALVALILTIAFHRPWWAGLLLFGGAVAALALGVRAHLRAAALRAQAMDRILAEAFKRAGQEPPSES